jgi:hypothetical protein
MNSLLGVAAAHRCSHCVSPLNADQCRDGHRQRNNDACRPAIRWGLRKGHRYVHVARFWLLSFVVNVRGPFLSLASHKPPCRSMPRALKGRTRALANNQIVDAEIDLGRCLVLQRDWCPWQCASRSIETPANTVLRDTISKSFVALFAQLGSSLPVFLVSRT